MESLEGQNHNSASQCSLVQVATRAKSIDRESKQDVSNPQKRREVPPRRACRNANDVPPEATGIPQIEQVKPEAPCNLTAEPMSTTLYQTNHGQFIAFTPGGAIQLSETMQGLQPLTMTNNGQSATVVQYSAQSGDNSQQYYHMPGNKVMVQAATGDMSAYHLQTPTSSLPQGVVMAGSPGPTRNPHQLVEDATRKREVRLMKNREAAKECRRRKREYVRCLETRLTMLEAANKKLMDDLQYFHEVYGSKTDFHGLKHSFKLFEMSSICPQNTKLSARFGLDDPSGK
ncbi:cAMP-responsive element modulator-like isoform X2 [Osmerus eperlanus]|uniref:cAMP-responsive element modulator-like isoform X2 n=1 Tax=Osmerus eperlanus TaxID=29151 RepID=UPI002E13DC50